MPDDWIKFKRLEWFSVSILEHEMNRARRDHATGRDVTIVVSILEHEMNRARQSAKEEIMKILDVSILEHEMNRARPPARNPVGLPRVFQSSSTK